MPRDTTNIQRYVSFIQMISNEEKLLPFDKLAIAEIIEEGVRLSGSQNKLSTRFNVIADIMKEAHFWALQVGKSIVTQSDVRKALKEQIQRNNLAEEKVLEAINEGSLLIDTDGKKVGQVNGLSVYEIAGRSFEIGRAHV